MRFEGARPLRRAPGLTPLVDVVFLLLIFFMLATRLGVESQLPLRLAVAVERAATDAAAHPDAASARASADAQDAAVVLRLDADGASWLAGERVESHVLTSRLIEALAEASAEEALGAQPSRPLVVMPEGAVSVQRIVDALQSAGDAGARSVSLTAAR